MSEPNPNMPGHKVWTYEIVTGNKIAFIFKYLSPTNLITPIRFESDGLFVDGDFAKAVKEQLEAKLRAEPRREK